jgi:hypothetical protein
MRYYLQQARLRGFHRPPRGGEGVSMGMRAHPPTAPPGAFIACIHLRIRFSFSYGAYGLQEEQY